MRLFSSAARRCGAVMLLALMLLGASWALADDTYSVTFMNPDGSVAAVAYAGSGEAVVPPGDTWAEADCARINGHALIRPWISNQSSKVRLGVMLNDRFFLVRTISLGSYRDDGDSYDAVKKTAITMDFMGTTYNWDTNTWYAGDDVNDITHYVSEGYKESYADMDYLDENDNTYVIPYNSAAPNQFKYYTVTFVYKDAAGATAADTQVVLHGGSATPPEVDSAYASWSWSSTGYQNVTSRQIIHLVQSQTTGYTITWKDQDGTVLFTQKVPAGETPVYGGPALTEYEDDDYYYTFTGWTPAITPASVNKTYTAVYSKEVKMYTLTIQRVCGEFVISTETVELANGASYDVDRSVYIPNYECTYSDIVTVTIAGEDMTVLVSYKAVSIPLELYGLLDGEFIALERNGARAYLTWVYREGKWGVCNYADPFNTYRPNWKYGSYSGVFSSANASAWQLGKTLDTLSACFGSSFTDNSGTDLTYNEVTTQVDDKADVYYLAPGDAVFYTVTFHYLNDPADASSGMTSTSVVVRRGGKATPPVTVEGWGWDSNEYLNVQSTCDIYHVQGRTVQLPVASADLVYTGQELCAIADGGYYTLTGHKAVDAGTHEAVATLAEGCFWPDGSSVPVTIIYTIAPAALTLTGVTRTLPYNGGNQTVSGYTAQGLVTEAHTISGIDWSATGKSAYSSYLGAFTGTAVITAADGTDVTGNYSVTTVLGKLTITRRDIADAIVTFPDGSEYVYTGSALTPAVEVAIGGWTLTASEGYSAAYTDNVDAGTATVTITGDTNCTGTVTQTFSILPRDLSGAEITVGPAYDDGAAQEPPVTVVVDGLTLAPGTDYTAAYADNTGAGQASVTITGQGNYTGSAAAAFSIVPISRMYLPENLTVIGAEAFRGVAVEAFVLPQGCREIQSAAFADCAGLLAVYFTSADAEIAPDAFSGSAQVILFAPAGGTVESWAAENGVSFRAR